MHEMLVVRGKIVEVANKCYQRISLKVRDCSLYGWPAGSPLLLARHPLGRL